MQDSKPAVELLQPSPLVRQKKEGLDDSFETAVRALEEARTAVLAARGQPPTVAQVPMIPVAEADEQQAAALRVERLKTATATQTAAALRTEIARLQTAAARQQAEIDELRGAAGEAEKGRAKARVNEVQLVRVQEMYAKMKKEREALAARGATLEGERADIAQRLRGLAQLVEAAPKDTGAASSATVPLRRAAPESAEESVVKRLRVDPLFAPKIRFVPKPASSAPLRAVTPTHL
ncbi:hypothetical protein GGX14DRAFT_647556 [Mycena pura]|uniref:Uncharacterized protein n=1 Tax=Mycena pura TaxID=153505 RepID=A0AAD6Y7T4_9AGAR|nr:hypothetical protein GGX14DRAFT_647556 [Mycena pura]